MMNINLNTSLSNSIINKLFTDICTIGIILLMCSVKEIGFVNDFYIKILAILFLLNKFFMILFKLVYILSRFVLYFFF